MVPRDDDESTAYAKVTPVTLPRLGRPGRLHLVQGPEAPETFLLQADELLVGRGSASDVQIHHESLSRRHARLRRRGLEYIIDDLDSVNGVYINGIRVHSVTLCHGDTLQLGDLVFRYEEGDL